MGMRSADAYLANQFDDFTLQTNRKIHRKRLREGKLVSDFDNKPPPRYKHVGVNDSKKAFLMKEYMRKIDAENAVLIRKMADIAKKGSRMPGAPPPRGAKTHRLNTGGNALARKERQQEIQRENKLMLRRITNADPNYSTNMLATQERQRLKYLSNMGRFNKRNRQGFVGNLQRALQRGSQTDRAHHSIDYDGIDPTRMALAKVGEEEMRLLINNKRPPGTVRKVFTALMILVSPFETSESDVQWTAVQEWVEQLGGVAEWLHNLWNFNVGLVPVSNTTKCKKYIVDHALFDEQLRVYSPCLANFLLWIQEVCASAQQLSDTASSLHDSVGDRGRTGGSSQKFAEADEFNSPQVLTAVVDSEEYSDEYDDDEPQGEQSAEPRPALVPVPPPGRPGAGGRPSTRDGGSRPGSQRAPRGMSGEGKEAAPPPVQATATAASEKKKAEGEGEGQSANAAAPAEAAPADESREVEANKAQVQQHATEATSNRDAAPEKQAEAEEAPPKARDTPEDAEAAPAAEEGEATEAAPASETVSAADEAEAPAAEEAPATEEAPAAEKAPAAEEAQAAEAAPAAEEAAPAAEEENDDEEADDYGEDEFEEADPDSPKT